MKKNMAKTLDDNLMAPVEELRVSVVFLIKIWQILSKMYKWKFKIGIVIGKDDIGIIFKNLHESHCVENSIFI